MMKIVAILTILLCMISAGCTDYDDAKATAERVETVRQQLVNEQARIEQSILTEQERFEREALGKPSDNPQ
jgi:O-acetyl-ADP-ribose deacetylase (regulator of RNase III)